MLTGTFNTQEVRPWNAPRAETSKLITFDKTLVKPPRLILGLNFLDIDRNANIRANTFARDITRNDFNLLINSWSDTKLYAGGASWLELSPENLEYQCGQFSTSEDHPWNKPQLHTSRRITFEQPFNAPPKVIVFLNQIDMAKGRNWRVVAKATDIDRSGFTIHLDTWANSVLYSARAGWIAYPSDKEYVFSGRSNTMEVRPWNHPQHKNSKTINFNGIKFSTSPNVFIAINSLDLDCKANLRLKVSADSVTPTGMTWNIDSWSDTVLYSAGISYICIDSSAKIPPTFPASTAPPLFALVIGIDTYKSHKHATLSGAVRDAEDVYDYLRTTLGVPPSQIRMLLNEKATRAAIVAELRALQTNPSINRNDPVLIYYAGHGAETSAPPAWKDSGPYIQMIVPYDEGTMAENSLVEVRGIPDRTIGALLNNIARDKGDNITVIFDCCHAASNTRMGAAGNSKIRVRRTAVSRDTPAKLDEDIWAPQPERRLRMSQIPKDLQHTGLRSHVLIAACGMRESAQEENGRGRFTAAFLATIQDVGTDLVTYDELIRRIPALPSQNPQCEGFNRDRAIFRGAALDIGRRYFPIRQEGETFVVDAGTLLGITRGAQFQVYAKAQSPPSGPSLGTLEVISADFSDSVLAVIPGSKPFTLPSPAYVLQTKPGMREAFKVHIRNVKLDDSDVAREIAAGLVKSQRANVIADIQGAELVIEIAPNGKEATFEAGSILVTQPSGGLLRLPKSVPWNPMAVLRVVNAAAAFFSNLNQTNPDDMLNGKIHVEFTRVERAGPSQSAQELSMTGDLLPESFVPVGENLISNGTISLEPPDPNAMYGITISNETTRPLYAYLFYFDTSDLTIDLYEPLTSSGGVMDENLPASSSLAVGVGGAGTHPRQYLLKDGQTLNVGFLKLFVTTKQVEFSSWVQRSPFVGQPQPQLRSSRPATLSEVQTWSSTLIPLILRAV